MAAHVAQAVYRIGAGTAPAPAPAPDPVAERASAHLTSASDPASAERASAHLASAPDVDPPYVY